MKGGGISTEPNGIPLAPSTVDTATSSPRIAVASSGLSHIKRGVESWAEDLAGALHRAGEKVTLFQGGGTPTESWRRVLPCFRRIEAPNKRLLALTRHVGGWRLGLGSPYSIEQTTFSLALWRAIRSDFDLLHVQDPQIAFLMDRLNRMGVSRPRVILGHGTEESNEFLRKLSYVQHLTPGYRDDYEPYRTATQLSFCVPNFIDIQRFSPARGRSARAIAREAFGFSTEALIILCVAALEKRHKRCDYMIQEFEQFRAQLPPTMASKVVLVLAGAREADTDDLIDLGKSLLGNSVVFLESIPRDRIATLYQTADIFALASLHEVFGIVFLEAMASGLPVSCHNTPTLQWITGDAGILEDITEPGGLVSQWQRLLDPSLRQNLSQLARARVEATFSEAEVLKQIKVMYHRVLEA